MIQVVDNIRKSLLNIVNIFLFNRKFINFSLNSDDMFISLKLRKVLKQKPLPLSSIIGYVMHN